MKNVLVCGPPCAGKTTYVEQHAKPDDLVVCYDTIAQRLGHTGPGRPPFKTGRRAEEEVQRLITVIEHGDIDGTAYVLRTMAGASRRAELAARIDADIVLLLPDRDELMARAAQRADPATTRRDIDRWLERERQG